MSSCLLVLVAAGVAAIGGANVAASTTPFKVSSTLDGRTLLPHRIRWIARTTLPSGAIAEVDFLIDGKLSWIAGDAYAFGGDEHAKHLGYLVTSWLSPGKHRFTVRATRPNGQTALDTVTARVLPPAAVPTALAGTWERAIDTSTAPAPNTPGNPTGTLTPAGTWKISFAPSWIENVFPGKYQRATSGNTGAGWILDSDWIPGPKTFDVFGAVSIPPFDTKPDPQRGGAWCHWDGPQASYSWSVSGNTHTRSGRRPRRLRHPRVHLGRHMDQSRLK